MKVFVENEVYADNRVVGDGLRYLDKNGELTSSKWAVNDAEWADADDALVADYVECQSEKFADRNNDTYDVDIDVRFAVGGKGKLVDGKWVTTKQGSEVNYGSYRSSDEAKTYTPAPGYDLLSAGIVRCWYCNGDFHFTEFASARRFVTEEANMQAFVTEMLVHYSEHKAANDLPWVRTYIKVAITRPDGSVVDIPENARRVTKPWQVKGGLL